jgi:hypothetical protein
MEECISKHMCLIVDFSANTGAMVLHAHFAMAIWIMPSETAQFTGTPLSGNISLMGLLVKDL